MLFLESIPNAYLSLILKLKVFWLLPKVEKATPMILFIDKESLLQFIFEINALQNEDVLDHIKIKVLNLFEPSH